MSAVNSALCLLPLGAVLIVSSAFADPLESGFPVPKECVEHALGTSECPTDAFVNGLSAVSPGYFTQFRSAKLESFYMSVVTSRLSEALVQVLAGNKCAGIEAEYFFGETSFIYLPPVEDIPAEVQESFKQWNDVVSNGMQYLSTQASGGC